VGGSIEGLRQRHYLATNFGLTEAGIFTDN
jgi:hypothetical protein